MNDNTTTKRIPSHRKISLTAGLLYLLTFVSNPNARSLRVDESANFVLSSSRHERNCKRHPRSHWL